MCPRSNISNKAARLLLPLSFVTSEIEMATMIAKLRNRNGKKCNHCLGRGLKSVISMERVNKNSKGPYANISESSIKTSKGYELNKPVKESPMAMIESARRKKNVARYLLL